jgi:hypothetical protein
MELPAEIRNMVYSYALADPSGIKFVATFKHKRRTVERVSGEMQAIASRGKGYRGRRYDNDDMAADQEEPATLVPSLLAVSKQVYTEGHDILYSNEFIFADTSALYNFLINLGPSGSKYLKTLRLRGWGYGRGAKTYNNACFAALVWATNIESFHFDSIYGFYRNSKSSAEQLYRDAFPWFEAVGAAKGKPDAAVDVIKLDKALFEYNTWNGTSQQTVSGDEKLEEFREKLRNLLGTQHMRAMGKPVKKRKVTKVVDADEL